MLLFAGALLFLFEEWLWTLMTRFFAWLGRFGLLRWLDARLVRLSPPVSLAILCLPIFCLLPFKVAGLWMIASGRFFSGCLIMLTAKVVSTAVIARIFLTCRPQLLTMPWFARLYAWTGLLRQRVHLWLGEQPAWFEAKRFMHRSKAHVRAWMLGTTRAASVAGRSSRRGTLKRWRMRRNTRRAQPPTSGFAAGSDGHDPDDR